MSVEERVLARIRPTPDEEARIEKLVREILDRLRSTLRSKGWEAKPFLAGSVAKGTHLTGTEIDVFVAFPPDLPRADLEDRGLALGTILEKGTHRYAEHPYTRGWYGGFEVEIVPCYRITDATQRMSAVDRTPLHVDYVLGRVKEGQTDEIRLLKAWAEGIGVYGAEAKILGFSGYLCELLVLKYGTFRGVLEASLSWRPGIVLELDRAPGRTFPEPPSRTMCYTRSFGRRTGLSSTSSIDTSSTCSTLASISPARTRFSSSSSRSIPYRASRVTWARPCG